MDNAEFEILRQLVEDNIVDVADLVALLEINIEDIIDRFPDRLKEHAEKFGYYPTEDVVEKEEEQEDVYEE